MNAVSRLKRRSPAEGNGHVPRHGATARARASLEMFEPRHVKGGKPELGDPKGKIEFQFNPKEVTISKSAKWERKPAKGKKAGPPEFTGAEPCKMTLEMFFDATIDGRRRRRSAVDKLFSCCVPWKEAARTKSRCRPWSCSTGASVTSFPAFVT